MIALGSVRAWALLALVIAAPWFSLLPLPGASEVVAETITLIAAFHGYGLLVASGLHREIAPALAVQWGIAVTIALAGVLIGIHGYGAAAPSIVVYAGAALHSMILGYRFSRRADRLVGRIRKVRSVYWIAPMILLVLVGALHILGAAGDVGARPFDDDGNHLGQLRRLLDTGTLGDGIGFPRTAQLGGQLAVSALANAVGGLGLTRMIDSGLGFALLLWLAISRIRPRDPATALWTVLIVIVASALPFVTPDPSPRWLAAGLVLALFVTIQDFAAEPALDALPIALVAGALATLRLELAPVAVVALVAAWVLRVRTPAQDSRRMAVLGIGSIAIVLPYLLVRFTARAGVADALELLPHRRGVPGWIVALLVVTVTSVAAWQLTRRLLPGLAGWVVVAAAVAIAAIGAELIGARSYSSTFVAPIAIGAGLALFASFLRSHPDESGAQPGTGLLVLALLACVVIFEGRDASGRVRWSRRYGELVSGVELSRVAWGRDFASEPAYVQLLRRVPAGAPVGIWVARPELVDHATHPIFDLRSPRIARDRLAKVIARLPVRYLLIELDHHGLAQRQETLFGRLWCASAPEDPLCLDELERLVSGNTLVASVDNVRLVALPSGR